MKDKIMKNKIMFLMMLYCLNSNASSFRQVTLQDIAKSCVVSENAVEIIKKANNIQELDVESFAFTLKQNKVFYMLSSGKREPFQLIIENDGFYFVNINQYQYDKSKIINTEVVGEKVLFNRNGELYFSESKIFSLEDLSTNIPEGFYKSNFFKNIDPYISYQNGKIVILPIPIEGCN